jgi:hypothetical protein
MDSSMQVSTPVHLLFNRPSEIRKHIEATPEDELVLEIVSRHFPGRWTCKE